MKTSDWTKDSWKSFPAMQQVEWPNQEKYQQVLQKINDLPPLVFAGEIRKLRSLLSRV